MAVFRGKIINEKENILIFITLVINCTPNGALAQLARALRWQCRGHRFESDILHNNVDLL